MSHAKQKRKTEGKGWSGKVIHMDKLLVFFRLH